MYHLKYLSFLLSASYFEVSNYLLSTVVILLCSRTSQVIPPIYLNPIPVVLSSPLPSPLVYTQLLTNIF